MKRKFKPLANKDSQVMSLRELRKRYGMKQYKCAELLGVPRSTLACWENGQRVPNRNAIMRIAQVFKLSYAEVCQMFMKAGETEWNLH